MNAQGPTCNGKSKTKSRYSLTKPKKSSNFRLHTSTVWKQSLQFLEDYYFADKEAVGQGTKFFASFSFWKTLLVNKRIRMFTSNIIFFEQRPFGVGCPSLYQVKRVDLLDAYDFPARTITESLVGLCGLSMQAPIHWRTCIQYICTHTRSHAPQTPQQTDCRFSVSVLTTDLFGVGNSRKGFWISTELAWLPSRYGHDENLVLAFVRMRSAMMCQCCIAACLIISQLDPLQMISPCFGAQNWKVIKITPCQIKLCDWEAKPQSWHKKGRVEHRSSRSIRREDSKLRKKTSREESQKLVFRLWREKQRGVQLYLKKKKEIMTSAVVWAFCTVSIVTMAILALLLFTHINVAVRRNVSERNPSRGSNRPAWMRGSRLPPRPRRIGCACGI